MFSRARIEIVGTIGKAPEVKGKTIKTSVAVKRREKTQAGWEDRTDWYNVVIVGDNNVSRAAAMNLAAGEQVFVSGSVEIRDCWTGKDGAAHADVCVVCYGDIERTQFEKKAVAAPAPRNEPVSNNAPEYDDSEDLPY